MQIEHQELADIRRFIENERAHGLKGKAAKYERYLRLLGKALEVNSETRILEVGTGTGWFPILCKANGLQCKGLEISPHLIVEAVRLGSEIGVVPDIELGNVEETDLGEERYDAIVASSVFEHVEKWREGLERLYWALRPGGALFFESTNKFSFTSGEYQGIPLYGWFPDSLRYRIRVAAQGPEIMRLGIDFNQFRYPQLRKTLREIGFRNVLDAVDLADLDRLRGYRRALVSAAKRSAPIRFVLLTFMDATTLVCTK
jgi:2-polyprenyl-3-methyl-5-hydroxy-6-metoxy-1,4-benzoquinol methylase